MGALSGEDFLRAFMAGSPEADEAYRAAMWSHIQHGTDPFDVLGLRGASGGDHSPRVRLMREWRDHLLVCLTGVLMDHGQTPWQAAQTIASLGFAVDGTVPDEVVDALDAYPSDVLDLFEELEAVSGNLDSYLRNPKAIYNRVRALVTEGAHLP